MRLRTLSVMPSCLSMLMSFCALFASQASAQEAYYYYKGKRVSLKIDERKDYVLLRSDIPREVLQSTTKSAGVVLRKVGDFSMPKNLELAEVAEDAQAKTWAIVDNISAEARPRIDQRIAEDVVYRSPFFLTPDGKEVGVSHLVYVKLKDGDDVDKLKKQAQAHKVNLIGNNKLMPLWYTLSCTKDSVGNALQVANKLYESGEFASAEPDFLADFNIQCADDSIFGDQWGMHNTGQSGGSEGIDVGACEAWNHTVGDPDIVVAVLDHGIELDHPDMPSISTSSYDTANGSSPSVVRGNHGTACAGIIGAARNNGEGIAGVAPDTTLMSISNSLLIGPDTVQELASGISWAWQNGAAVISNSWGHDLLASSFIDDAISEALTHGRDGRGCVVVFAAGNNNGDIIYPANSNPDLLVVGAMSPCAERKNPSSCDPESFWGSCFGPQLDVVAPGVLIPTTDRQGAAGYDSGDYTGRFNGTSSATPHVAGVAALILSVAPELSRQQVVDVIESTARKVGPYAYQPASSRSNGAWHLEMGYGLVDAAACLAAATGSKPVAEQFADQTSPTPAIAALPATATVEDSGNYLSAQKRQEGTEPCDDCDTSNGRVVHFRIVEQDGKFSLKQAEPSAALEQSVNADSPAVMITQARSGQVELRPECTSDPTEWSGARRSCTSNWSSVTAPPGFVFNEHSLSKAYTGRNGSSNRIDHEWDSFVEIVPGTGLRAPRVLRVRVHARSPECRGCRGWTKAHITATYVAYQ